jgi:hypothetical protein
LFIKRQVLVNFVPRVIRELSGTVTSSTSRALSLQAPVEDIGEVPVVPSGAPGVVVVDGSRVEVGGTFVGSDKPALVGGRVDVTKIGAAVISGSCTTSRQAFRLRLASKSNIQIFFIEGDSTLEILKAPSRRFE